MSKFVDEIIADIKNNPTNWKDYKGYGVSKDNIVIAGFGNSKLLSVTCIYINDKRIPTTYMDNYRLESCIGNWYKTVSLNTILI